MARAGHPRPSRPRACRARRDAEAADDAGLAVDESMGYRSRRRGGRGRCSRRSPGGCRAARPPDPALESQHRPHCRRPVRDLCPVHSGKCVTLPGGWSTNGNVLDQYTCLSPVPSNQLWYFEHYSSIYFRIVAYPTAKCADIANNSTADGAKVHQWDCISTTVSQRWYVRT